MIHQKNLKKMSKKNKKKFKIRIKNKKDFKLNTESNENNQEIKKNYI